MRKFSVVGALVAIASLASASFGQTVTLPAALAPDAVVTSVFTSGTTTAIIGFGMLSILLGLVAAAFHMFKGRTRRIAK